MRIPVLIEPISDDRYRASGCEPFVGSVEAETPDAALAKMKQLLADRLSRGARIETIEVSRLPAPGTPLPAPANPWLDGAGMFRDDPFFDDWQQAMVEYRRDMNQVADAP